MNRWDNELLCYINSTLEKDYRELAVLKKTADTEIYLYEHQTQHQKIIKRIQTNRNDGVFRTLRNKKCDHLPIIHEVCSDEKSVVVLEEYISGESLEQILKNAPLPKSCACRYAYQLCDALTFLHHRGIIHRDIKPSNVIINSEGQAVLIDLGIARSISERDESDTKNLGTAGYAAPEQFGITQSGVATDIYALGVLLNMLLTGAHPTVSSPRGILKKIINKATATQISRRYQSAGKMKRDLRFFIKKSRDRQSGSPRP